MDTSLLPPLLGTTLTPRAVDGGWKLNQVLQATVVATATQGKLLRIDGNHYTPLNKLEVAPGSTLQLRVAALSPRIELALLDPGRSLGAAAPNAGIILSDKLLHRARPGAPSLPLAGPGLQRFLALLENLSGPSASPNPLPPATQALLAALRERFVNPDQLVHPRPLRAALSDASLLLQGHPLPVDAGKSGADLKALWLQLVRSLGGGNPGGAAETGLGNAGRAAQPYGLALYQSVDRSALGLAGLFAREVEEEFLRLLRYQQRMPDPNDDLTQRWLFELPVNFQDRPRSVTIRLLHEHKQRGRHAAESSWRAEFTFTLPHCGRVHASLFLASGRVSVILASERAATAQLFARHADVLAEKLGHHQLELDELRCTTRPAARFPALLPDMESGEEDPDRVYLQEFRMRENERPCTPGVRIPEELYCAMASLFGYILALEATL